MKASEMGSSFAVSGNLRANSGGRGRTRVLKSCLENKKTLHVLF